MVFFEILKLSFRLTVFSAITVFLITFLPGLPPNVKITESYRISKADLTGKLHPNNKLDDVEFLFVNKLLGTESFTDDSDFIYAPQKTGEIKKFVKEDISTVTTFGIGENNSCHNEDCGLPAAIRFGNDGFIYATDLKYGIFRVDVETGAKQKLVSVGQEIEGRITRTPNSLAVACNGDIFWTDTNTFLNVDRFLYFLLADPSGRLVHYDAKTKKNKVLIENVHLANGVILSQNEDFVLVTESGKNRILQYHLKGPKTGTTDVFLDGLPGFADNFDTDGGSGFLLSIIWEAHPDSPDILVALSQYPLVKRFIVRCVALLEFGLKFIQSLYSTEMSENTFNLITSYWLPLQSKKQAILHIAENGEVLNSIWNEEKIMGPFSEGHIVKDELYLCSPFADYICRIPLSKIGWDHLKQETDSLTSVRRKCSNIA